MTALALLSLAYALLLDGYVRAGWSAATLSDSRVLLSRTSKPDTGTTIILALFFVLPALIYIISS